MWFNEVITGTPRQELGPATPDASFTLDEVDTVARIRAEHLRVCEQSRRRVADLSLDDTVTDIQSKPVTVRFLCLQTLREYAQHTGHADILREQILAAR